MKHILAVDDNSANLQMVRGILQKLYQVTPVNNGERALQFLERKTPDLILLDILMPEMDGLETLKRIKAKPECKDIPIIMLTGLGDDEMLNACIAVLPPHIIVHRITGDGAKKDLVAPLWSGDKKKVLNYLHKVLSCVV